MFNSHAQVNNKDGVSVAWNKYGGAWPAYGSQRISHSYSLVSMGLHSYSCRYQLSKCVAGWVSVEEMDPAKV